MTRKPTGNLQASATAEYAIHVIESLSGAELERFADRFFEAMNGFYKEKYEHRQGYELSKIKLSDFAKFLGRKRWFLRNSTFEEIAYMLQMAVFLKRAAVTNELASIHVTSALRDYKRQRNPKPRKTERNESIAREHFVDGKSYQAIALDRQMKDKTVESICRRFKKKSGPPPRDWA